MQRESEWRPRALSEHCRTRVSQSFLWIANPCCQNSQDASSLLAALLEPEAFHGIAARRAVCRQAMATMCCAGRHWAGPALAFNWADHCEALVALAFH